MYGWMGPVERFLPEGPSGQRAGRCRSSNVGMFGGGQPRGAKLGQQDELRSARVDGATMAGRVRTFLLHLPWVCAPTLDPVGN